MNFDRIFTTENIWIELLVLIVSICLAILVHHLLFKFLIGRKILKKNRADVKTLCKALYSPSRILLVIVVVLFLFPLLNTLTSSLTGFPRHLLSIFFISVIAWLLIKAIRAGRLILMRKYDISAQDNFEARKAYTQFHMIENILIFLVVILSIGIALMTFESVREVGVSLLASAGIAGIILGFAAQKLIATILAGIQIAITQPVRIDDVVIVEGEWGRIEEMTLTYVVVKIWDERRMVLPTTYFIEKPFENWTRTSAQILGTVYLLLDYRVPLNKLRQELTRLLESTDLWDKRVNVLQVTDSKVNTVEIRVLVSARNSSIAWDLRVFIREKLLEFLQLNYPESLPRSRVNIEEMDTKEGTD